MNYKHLYHAGNFCDVFKQVTLISLIDFMKKKDKPFCYLETHAGAGRYDLTSKVAEKTREYKNGIAKLVQVAMNIKENPKALELEVQAALQNNNNSKMLKNNSISYRMPKIIQNYLTVIQEKGYPNFFAGSPLIGESQLRSDDRMVLMELHNEESKDLKDLFFYNKQVAVHHQDGYQGLKAFLPPKERRGLIFIDPPYEKPNEWEEIIKNLEIARQRFPAGVYAIWYPLKDKEAVQSFQKELKKLNEVEIAIAEICIYPEDIMKGLIGCGMVIINPPWQWSEKFSSVLPWLWKALSVNGQGSYRLIKS